MLLGSIGRHFDFGRESWELREGPVSLGHPCDACSFLHVLPFRFDSSFCFVSDWATAGDIGIDYVPSTGKLISCLNECALASKCCSGKRFNYMYVLAGTKVVSAVYTWPANWYHTAWKKAFLSYFFYLIYVRYELDCFYPAVSLNILPTKTMLLLYYIYCYQIICFSSWIV